MTLDEGKNKEIFIVDDIKQNKKMKKRLQDMGLTKGTSIKILSNNTGGSFILNIRGSRVVIGKTVAEKIYVQPSKHKVFNLNAVGNAC
ncbi:hypothetical protein SH1V18_35190 [Vallitalea longa]|uniref:Ferrous iron transporter FeoA-like domain-containing protein n=1 Tax=Vallitalea longa TaxID=2936439 RepID=A0A9W6DHN3_9FIRM|nr:FeoA family protein [Vallitalea longa]GKX31039.1 hypothetical protein SH1V18_35190 [Vallitalea longa]